MTATPARSRPSVTRHWLRSLLLGAALSAAVCAPTMASTDEQRATETQLKQIQQAIADLQSRLKKTRQRYSAAQQALRALEQKINVAAQLLRSTESRLQKAEDKLTRLRREQRSLQQQIQLQKTVLADQVRASFMAGRQPYLKLLLNQEDPSKVGRLLRYYDFLNSARGEKIDALLSDIERLVKVTQEIQQEVEQLAQLKRSQEQEQQQLTQLKQEREQAVRKWAKSVSQQDQKLAQLKASERELQEVLDKLRETLAQMEGEQSLTGLGKLQGQLSWPTQGRLTANFGQQRQEGFNWNGLVISTSEGKGVHAVFHGRVVFADWLRGFGLLTIVDHGAGYMSLYGHNQSLFKQPGDWVEAGELIATVGQSGGQQDASLYFEIRHQGKPRDPLKWLKRR